MKKLTKETFNPDGFKFVDLGLPSGRLWATENAPGYYTHEAAEQTFGDYLPKGAAMVELIDECKVEWNEDRHGLHITGLNGNNIFLPAAGFVDCFTKVAHDVDLEGNYWTSMRYVPKSESYGSNSSLCDAWCLNFSSVNLSPLLCTYRFNSYSIRVCKTIKEER